MPESQEKWNQKIETLTSSYQKKFDTVSGRLSNYGKDKIREIRINLIYAAATAIGSQLRSQCKDLKNAQAAAMRSRFMLPSDGHGGLWSKVPEEQYQGISELVQGFKALEDGKKYRWQKDETSELNLQQTIDKEYDTFASLTGEPGVNAKSLIALREACMNAIGQKCGYDYNTHYSEECDKMLFKHLTINFGSDLTEQTQQINDAFLQAIEKAQAEQAQQSNLQEVSGETSLEVVLWTPSGGEMRQFIDASGSSKAPGTSHAEEALQKRRAEDQNRVKVIKMGKV
jgi:hypothetical protein